MRNYTVHAGVHNSTGYTYRLFFSKIPLRDFPQIVKEHMKKKSLSKVALRKISCT